MMRLFVGMFDIDDGMEPAICNNQCHGRASPKAS